MNRIKDIIIVILTIAVTGLGLALILRKPETAVTESSAEIQIQTTETQTEPTEQTEVLHNGNELFEDMESGMSFCFAGDSITAGSAYEGALPWYEPLTPYIRGEVSNFSMGGWTSSWLVNMSYELPASDVYVIAIGINDVLFIDQPLGAGSAEEFDTNLGLFEEAIRNVSPDAKIYYIAVWPFLDQDPSAYECKDDFDNVIRGRCNGEDIIFIDPTETILNVLNSSDPSVYMWNEYHPSTPEGIDLYSYAVLTSG